MPGGGLRAGRFDKRKPPAQDRHNGHKPVMFRLTGHAVKQGRCHGAPPKSRSSGRNRSLRYSRVSASSARTAA